MQCMYLLECPGGPLGAEDGRLRDDQFSASSEKNKYALLCLFTFAIRKDLRI